MNLRINKIQISSIYSKLTFLFIFFAFVLVLLIVYFCLAKAVIYITPVKKDVSAEFIFNVKQLEEGESLVSEDVKGVVVQNVVEGEKAVMTTGEKTIEKQGKTVGKVTLINNYSKDQPLVATTRLMTPDNILFRIDKTVIVPSGGIVEVEVYPDNPDDLKNKTISKTKFTIPGLWEGLQDKIYAESKSEFSLKEEKVKFVTAEDIENGKNDLVDELYEKTLNEIKPKYEQENLTVLVSKELVQTLAEKEIDQIADSFRMTVRLKVNIVAFSQDDILKLIEKKLNNEVEDGHELVSINLDSLKYSIEKIDMMDNTAAVKVSATGRAIIKIESSLLDKSALAGLSEDSVRKKLLTNDSIDEISIKFSPQWMSRMPYLKNHISVILEK